MEPACTTPQAFRVDHLRVPRGRAAIPGAGGEWWERGAEAERRHQERPTVQVDQRCPRSSEMETGAKDWADTSSPCRRLQRRRKACAGAQHTACDRRQRALAPSRLALLRLWQSLAPA